MRGRRFFALVLALALLGGCGWMDGSYVSVTPHQVGLNQSADENTRAISTYTELRGALVELIDEGSKVYYDDEVADGKVRGNCHLIWGDADIFAGK